jgi:hypothetical protein
LSKNNRLLKNRPELRRSNVFYKRRKRVNEFNRKKMHKSVRVSD